MGLCKDCFHREVCESWNTINLDDIPPEIPCGHFKDTADVAPRAEVAREIFREMDKLLLSIIIDDEAEESFVWLDFDKYIALKKKYTDAETEPPKGD